MRLPELYIARHAETVYNAAARMQGWRAHTPLTHTGIAQAHAMGQALRTALGPKPDIALWCSTAGRTQQTMAILCEHLERDFFDVTLDDRLQEINVGAWEGRYYRDIVAEDGPVMDRARRLFLRRPPGGEWYDDIAVRLESWLRQLAAERRPTLVITHGMTGRVLRGALAGGTPPGDGDGPPIAADSPQGTVFRVRDGLAEALFTPGQSGNPGQSGSPSLSGNPSGAV